MTTWQELRKANPDLTRRSAQYLARKANAKVEADALIEAATDLEVAVDDYTATVYGHKVKADNFGYAPGSSTKNEDANYVARLRGEVVKAATQVALAMADADVNGTKLVEIVPEGLREKCADAEIEALRGAQVLVKRARCARCAGTGQFITYVENGVPKGPGGICYRCGGKGYTTTADRKRNYGYDNFAPIPGLAY